MKNNPVFRAFLMILSLLALTLSASCGKKEEPFPVLDPSGVPCVCIDAGHGFDDPGAMSDKLNGQTESDVTLSVTRLLADELTIRGITVLLTHDGETFPLEATADEGGKLVFRPQDRVEYAQAQPIDLFVSLHCDSFPSDASVRGTRVYYASDGESGPLSGRAVKAVCAAVDAAFPDAKKSLAKPMTGDGAYYVLRKATYPSVLIEMGFITNDADAADLTDPGWQRSFAQAVAEGIAKLFDLTQGS